MKRSEVDAILKTTMFKRGVCQPRAAHKRVWTRYYADANRAKAVLKKRLPAECEVVMVPAEYPETGGQVGRTIRVTFPMEE